MNALIVDDDEVNLILLEAILLRLGYSVTKSTRVDEAIDHFRLDHYQVVISDFHMPDQNGDQFISEIRKIERSESRATAMIIGTSSEVGNHIKKQFLDSGATCFMPKPTRLKHLTEMISTHFSQNVS